MTMLFLQSGTEESVQGFEIDIQDESSDLNYSYKFIKEKKNGKLFIYSPDVGYMNTILSIKEDKRKSKNFTFTDGDEGKMYELMRLKKLNDISHSHIGILYNWFLSNGCMGGKNIS